MRIGFIGLGNMGLAMAGNLVRAGHALTVYNRTPGRAAGLPAPGARAADTPRDVAADAEVIVTMLADDDALMATMFGADGATCAGCHGTDAKGTPLAPDLTANKWLWGDGSYASIVKTIRQGVPSPKEHTGVMPPMGGAQLTPAQLAAVGAYVFSLSHPDGG